MAMMDKFEPCEATCPRCGAKLAYTFASGYACPRCETGAAPIEFGYMEVDGRRLPFRTVDIPRYGPANVSSKTVEDSVIGDDGDPVSPGAELFDSRILYYVDDGKFEELPDGELGETVYAECFG